jgi:hypothetical protein
MQTRLATGKCVDGDPNYSKLGPQTAVPLTNSNNNLEPKQTSVLWSMWSLNLTGRFYHEAINYAHTDTTTHTHLLRDKPREKAIRKSFSGMQLCWGRKFGNQMGWRLGMFSNQSKEGLGLLAAYKSSLTCNCFLSSAVKLYVSSWSVENKLV